MCLRVLCCPHCHGLDLPSARRPLRCEILTDSRRPAGREDMFSRPEQIRYRSAHQAKKPVADRHTYNPFRYVSSRQVSALEVLDHIVRVAR